jgi:predicted outer membrane repeat protein
VLNISHHTRLLLSCKVLSGGGIFGTSAGTATIRNAQFLHNTAKQQGGGLVYTGADAVVSCTNCTFAHNRAGGSGGGLFFEAGALSVTQSTFRNNTSGRQGGAAMVQDPVEFLAQGCAAVQNTASNGGAFYFASTKEAILPLEGMDFTGNSADAGGAVYGKGALLLNATDTSFTNNMVRSRCRCCRAANSYSLHDVTMNSVCDSALAGHIAASVLPAAHSVLVCPS